MSVEQSPRREVETGWHSVMLMPDRTPYPVAKAKSGSFISVPPYLRKAKLPG